MPKAPRSYQLSADLVAAHASGPVVCLEAGAVGRTYRLRSRRPGAEGNLFASRLEDGTVEWSADLPSGASHVITAVEPPPALVRVDIVGPLEQRAGFYDMCGGWSDGHDAVCERLCAAFETGDVLLVVDSPGGAAAGIQEAVTRALRAKAATGRRVTVFADEMIGSAAYWWAACLGDEIFLPQQGIVGSIGARAAHASIAGALAQEGVEITHFADPPEKVALAPEKPLSDEGRRRGMRDVSLAADAFRAAVCASPIGLRNGLTPEGLIELGADALTGQLAVNAGIADAVASLDDVTEYALALAGGADGENMPKLRAEGDEPDKDADGDGAPEEARAEPPPADKAECSGCHMANPSHAKYCLGCGEPMGAEGDESEESAEDDEPPSSSKPAKDARAKAEPPPAKEDASLASLLGCREGASAVALRTAAMRQRQVIDHASRLTGQATMSGIIGGLTALAEDAKQSADLRSKLRAEQRRCNDRERVELLTKLAGAGLPGYQRGDVFVDDVSEDGHRRGVKPAPVFAEMKLGTLRGLVENKLANSGATAARRNPFDPSEVAARAQANKARGVPSGEPTAEDIERAKAEPAVLRMFNAPGNTKDIGAIAKHFLIEAQKAGGVQ